MTTRGDLGIAAGEELAGGGIYTWKREKLPANATVFLNHGAVPGELVASLDALLDDAGRMLMGVVFTGMPILFAIALAADPAPMDRKAIIPKEAWPDGEAVSLNRFFSGSMDCKRMICIAHHSK